MKVRQGKQTSKLKRIGACVIPRPNPVPPPRPRALADLLGGRSRTPASCSFPSHPCLLLLLFPRLHKKRRCPVRGSVSVQGTDFLKGSISLPSPPHHQGHRGPRHSFTLCPALWVPVCSLSVPLPLRGHPLSPESPAI